MALWSPSTWISTTAFLCLLKTLFFMPYSPPFTKCPREQVPYFGFADVPSWWSRAVHPRWTLCEVCPQGLMATGAGAWCPSEPHWPCSLGSSGWVLCDASTVELLFFSLQLISRPWGGSLSRADTCSLSECPPRLASIAASLRSMISNPSLSPTWLSTVQNPPFSLVDGLID